MVRRAKWLWPAHAYVTLGKLRHFYSYASLVLEPRVHQRQLSLSYWRMPSFSNRAALCKTFLILAPNPTLTDSRASDSIVLSRKLLETPK